MLRIDDRRRQLPTVRPNTSKGLVGSLVRHSVGCRVCRDRAAVRVLHWHGPNRRDSVPRWATCAAAIGRLRAAGGGHPAEEAEVIRLPHGCGKIASKNRRSISARIPHASASVRSPAKPAGSGARTEQGLRSAGWCTGEVGMFAHRVGMTRGYAGRARPRNVRGAAFSPRRPPIPCPRRRAGTATPSPFRAAHRGRGRPASPASPARRPSPTAGPGRRSSPASRGCTTPG